MNSKNNHKELLATGNWLELSCYHWQNTKGENFKWESVDRKKNTGAVLVIATLKPSNRLLLIQQFRPPTNKIMLEFPAGLINSNETAESAALRELKEETGYIGQIQSISNPVWSSPGLTGESLQIVLASVDETLPENQNPITHFDPSEEIETFLVPKQSLSEFITQQENNGIGIDSKLYAFQLALQF